MARLSRECVVTEKIDGTNAQVLVEPIAHMDYPPEGAVAIVDRFALFAGSRTRWLSTESRGTDNFGFAGWVRDNAPELVTLGEGRHFGEWYGSGIQRNYGLKEKRFALFDTTRWNAEECPACCEAVPVLYRGIFDTAEVEKALDFLRYEGSVAVPGFMNPEGVVVFHEAARVGFKKTLDNDALPKSLV